MRILTHEIRVQEIKMRDSYDTASELQT